MLLASLLLPFNLFIVRLGVIVLVLAFLYSPYLVSNGCLSREVTFLCSFNALYCLNFPFFQLLLYMNRKTILEGLRTSILCLMISKNY